MSDLIKREDAIATIGVMYERCDTYDITDYRDLMLEAVKVLPSADRPQGEWEEVEASKDSDGHAMFRECTCCGRSQLWMNAVVYNYCPNCGARMKGAGDEA